MANEEANSGTAAGGGYDVFLSFRGPDIRNTFADCLYVFLKIRGIRVFRDDEELRPGEKISEILRAVENSRIYIPIFSKNYASSRWCLRELKCMVVSHGRSPRKHILPIFYDVEPGDVKLETEVYKSALTKHEKELGCTEVKQWKEALTTVARIKGWHIKDKRQGEVIEDIVKDVLLKINTTKRDLPAHLVGIDDRVEDIKRLLNCYYTSDVRSVIIYGIGGIGKTTLASAVFNEISPQFEGHSFLLNIQESSSHGGIEKMQRKLVADLFGYSLPETVDFDNGNNIIRERLPNRRVLIVFDGMDKNDRFMQLAKHCTLCGPGSRIIITTRDRSVFHVTKVKGSKENISIESRQIFLYEMKEMHFDHAFELFNKLAFDADSARSDLYDLSKEVVELTGGLPLALRKISSDLHNQSKARWISTLKKLKKEPHPEVQRKLKISYDALEYGAKQIFLDIACFFVDKKKFDAMHMWEACDLSPDSYIEVLISKSLIKIDDCGRIKMHSQLRDFGRKIVHEETIGKPGEPSRLVFLQTALDIVRIKKGIENVVALTLWKLRHNFTREDFANLMKVRFLELDGGNFIGDFENILSELRWLCWRNCPPKLRANNFVLKHLVVLKLSGDITAEEWSRWIKIMAATTLEVLKIAGSNSLMKTPCFTEFMSLKRLVVKDFPRLTQIDHTIDKLEQLTYLKIKYCPCLKKLPENIGSLTDLREFSLIQGFSVHYLPSSIGNLRNLSRLVVEDTGLVDLPGSIRWLEGLKYLSLANCTSLNSLPYAVGMLRSLTELDLSGTTIEKLPRFIWSREYLTLRMNSSKIRKVMTDLPLLGGIEEHREALTYRMEDHLEGATTQALEDFKFRYRALEYQATQIFLDIACFFVNKKISNAVYMWKACDLFSEGAIDDLVDKSLIKIVDGQRIKMRDHNRDFGRIIVRQENMDESGYRSRLWIPKMASDIVQAQKGTGNVVALKLGRSRHSFTSKEFANLMNVRFLELDGGNFADNFENILSELRWLCWRNCPPKLKAKNFVLNHLVVLKLSGNITTEHWSTWVKITVASKLKVLNLARSKSLIKTPGFSEFTSLERLVLKDLPNLVEIDGSIGKLKQLVSLKIKQCPCLKELPEEICCLADLRELILIQGSNVCYLPNSISNLRRLSRLVIKETGLVELPDTIKELVDLKHLCLANCTSLNSLSVAVGELMSLSELDLSGTSIEELPPSLWNFKVLTIWLNGSKIENRLMRYRPFVKDLTYRLGLGLYHELPTLHCLFKGPMLSINFPVCPMELLVQERRATVAREFHEHHLSGRRPSKILARVIFPHSGDWQINIVAIIPCQSTGIMSSSRPILYIINVILMLVSWLERKSVSKWLHDFQRKEEELLSLEFCDHCMSITSEIREFSDSPSLESFHLFPRLYIAVSMTLCEPGHSDQIDCRVEKLKLLTKSSSSIMRSTNLLLQRRGHSTNLLLQRRGH